jgi:ribosomal protein L30E
MKTIEEYTKFVIEILQEDVKEGKLIIEKSEITDNKREVTIDFVFVAKNCPKKMRVTFDYNELTNRIKCKKTTLQN